VGAKRWQINRTRSSNLERTGKRTRAADNREVSLGETFPARYLHVSAAMLVMLTSSR